MLTIFAMPKAFVGHTGVIQRNAIESWCRIRPRPEIVLLGADPGTAEICAELGLRHEPEVERNERGIPTLRGTLAAGERVASHDRVCYVNCDIIFPSDFLSAIAPAIAAAPDGLIIGQRRNLDVTEPLPFAGDWEKPLMERAAREGKLSGVDFFVYPRGFPWEMPPFAIGRSSHEKWMIWRVRSLGRRVVDVTRAVRAVHQNHPYVAGPGSAEQERVRALERQSNLSMAPASHYMTVHDATHVLVGSRVRPNALRFRPYRRLVHGAVGLASRSLDRLARTSSPGGRLAGAIRAAGRRFLRV